MAPHRLISELIGPQLRRPFSRTNAFPMILAAGDAYMSERGMRYPVNPTGDIRELIVVKGRMPLRGGTMSTAILHS